MIGYILGGLAGAVDINNVSVYQQGLLYAKEALALAQETENKWLMGDAYFKRAGYISDKQPRRILTFYRASLACLREAGDLIYAIHLIPHIWIYALALSEHELARQTMQDYRAIAQYLYEQPLLVPWPLSMFLFYLCCDAVAQRQLRRAVVLLAAANQLVVKYGHAPLRFSHQIKELKELVDEPTYSSAWEQGIAMSLIQAIDYALGFEYSAK